MMPYIDDVLKSDEPASLEIYAMRFRGTRPLDDNEKLQRLLNGKRKRGSGRGVIDYEVITANKSELLAIIKANFDDKIDKYLSQKT